jgi:acyl carrier protein
VTDQQLDTDLRQRVVDSVCTLLPRVIKRELPGMSETTRLDELDLTSAHMLELMLEIEDALAIQVDVEEFEEADAESVGTLASYVAGHSLIG